MFKVVKNFTSKIGMSRLSNNNVETFLQLNDGLQSTQSGISISGDAALSIPAVFQAVRLISETVGSLPCKLYSNSGKDKETARGHSAYRISHNRANEWTAAGQLRQDLTADALIYGGGFAHVTRFDDGRPYELHRLSPDKVTVLQDSVTGAPVYRVGDSTSYNHYAFNEILHISPFLGSSPIDFGREALGLASVLESHVAKLFKNGARPAAVLQREKAIPSDSAVGAKVIESLKERWRMARLSGFDVPLMLDDDWKYLQMALSSTDAQFLENRVFQIDEIARVFGVPPTMLFELERGTWSNAEQMHSSFLQLCLRPWLDRWQDAYATVLLTEHEQDSHYFEFVVDDLQRTEAAPRAEIFGKLIAARVMTPNEVRATMNLPAMEGGDELANPYTTTSNLTNEPSPVQSKE